MSSKSPYIKLTKQVLRKVALAFVDGETLVRGPLIVAQIDGEVQLRSYGEIIMRKTGIHLYAGVGTDPVLRSHNVEVIEEVLSFYGCYIHTDETDGEYSLCTHHQVAETADGFEVGIWVLHQKPHILPVFAAYPHFTVVDRAGTYRKGPVPQRPENSVFWGDVEEPTIEVTVGLLTPTGRPSKSGKGLSAHVTASDPRVQWLSRGSVTLLLLNQIAWAASSDPIIRKSLHDLRRAGRKLNTIVAREEYAWPC